MVNIYLDEYFYCFLLGFCFKNLDFLLPNTQHFDFSAFTLFVTVIVTFLQFKKKHFHVFVVREKYI